MDASFRAVDSDRFLEFSTGKEQASSRLGPGISR